MRTNAKRYFAICGRRLDQSIVVSHPVFKDEGLPVLRSRFAQDKGCSVTCLIPCSKEDSYEVLKALAIEVLTPVQRLVDKGAQNPFLRA